MQYSVYLLLGQQGHARAVVMSHSSAEIQCHSARFAS